MRVIISPLCLFIMAVVLIITGCAFGHFITEKIVLISNWKLWMSIILLALAAVYLSSKKDIFGTTQNRPSVED